MPEIKLSLDDPSLALDALEVAQADARHEQDTASVTVLADLRAQIERQLPKAPVEEPTGDVVIAASSGWFFKPGWIGWVRDDLKPYTWEDVLEFGDPVVYRRESAEPTPEQVEAAPACNCDYVARGGPGATPERPVEHHPLCDINLPADKRSGPHAQVEADLAQDEQAHTRYYAQAASAPAGDAIQALVEEFARQVWEATNSPGGLVRPILRDLIARVLEVGGQQPGVPVVGK